jgi:hypothetical protein
LIPAGGLRYRQAVVGDIELQHLGKGLPDRSDARLAEPEEV